MFITRQDWTTGYHAVNIDRANIEIPSEKLSKNNLKIGDLVGFNNDGTQVAGIIVRLNHKTCIIDDRTSSKL